MKQSKKIIDYWNERARKFVEQGKNESGNTLYDDNLRELEIRALLKYIPNNSKGTDIGCGNGYSSLRFVEKNNIHITGIDVSEEMIKNAEELLKKKKAVIKGTANFQIGDVMNPSTLSKEQDFIITERCLINLQTWENQQIALLNIHSSLKKGGFFLMLEGFINNLNTLNEVRKRFDLKPIEVVWHNIFFDKEKFESFISNYFTIEKVDNYGSTYMLLTRTYLHTIQEEGTFDNNLDYLATLLPNHGNYNYQQLYILKKK